MAFASTSAAVWRSPLSSTLTPTCCRPLLALHSRSITDRRRKANEKDEDDLEGGFSALDEDKSGVMPKRQGTNVERAGKAGGSAKEQVGTVVFDSRPMRRPSSPAFGPGSAAYARQRSQVLQIGNFVKHFTPGQHLPPHSLRPDNIHGLQRTYGLFPLRGPNRDYIHLSDPFLAVKIDPRKEPGNAALLKPFTSLTGRILGRKENGLGAKSQQRIKKSIKKARHFGFLPYFSDLGAPQDAWDEYRKDSVLRAAPRPGYER